MSTIVICHGAWSAGWAWKKMRPLLRAAGHEVFTPTYTGLGERSHQASPAVTLDTHIEDVLAMLQCEDLADVVLVGHSYGGMVATGVADRAAERIGRLIYLDAFVPRDGQSLDSLLPMHVRNRRSSTVEAQGDHSLLPPNPSPPDTSPEDLAWITPRRRWQPIRTFTQPLAVANRSVAIARSYIYCTRTGPDDVFAQFVARAKTEAGWTYHELDASHSPNVTAPEALASLFDAIIKT